MPGGRGLSDNLSSCVYVIFMRGKNEFVGSVRFKGSFTEELLCTSFEPFDK